MNKIKFSMLCVFLSVISNVVVADDSKDYKNYRINPDPNLDALTVISTTSLVNGAVAGFRCPDGSVTADMNDICGIESIVYPISGKVFIPVVNMFNGETLATGPQVGTIEATPEFNPELLSLANPSVDWTTLPSLPWTMSKFVMKFGGSTFEYLDGMELNGSTYASFGPVEIPNQTNGASLRLAGCIGLAEVSGSGKYANMVGSLCLNGTISFQPNFDGRGVSNCIVVLHEKI